MKKNKMLAIKIPFIILMTLVVILTTTCIDSSVSRRRATATTEDKSSSDGETDDSSSTKDIFIPSVDIRHVVDPMTKSFKNKVTIPKNFNGYFYLSGLNVGTLSDRIVKVRFKFGMEMESMTLPATIGRASGLTPSSDIQVLIIDMSARPFSNVRLLYDLYDYNAYSSTSNPTYDPYNGNLYCRGLPLSYDPTFTPYPGKCSLSASSCAYNMQACDHASDVCYYVYAKIKDKGLVDDDGLIISPSEPLVDLTGTDFIFKSTDTVTTIHDQNRENLKKCLPDNGVLRFDTTNNYKRIRFDGGGSVAGYGQEVMTLTNGASTSPYYYKGPYRIIGKNYWGLTKEAAISSNGIFESTLSNSGDLDKGTKSLMFPRAGKMDLSAGIQHVSSLTAFPTDVRSVDSLLVAGETSYMDGCSLRSSQYDSYLNEHMGSCNVTAIIEVITTNKKTGEDVVLAATSEVKIQLIRSRDLDFSGNETDYQTLKSCTTSKTCGANECCFNQRCWSKELVSQCVEDIDGEGNFSNGALCTSDYQCVSLCCDRSLGRCANHNPNLDPAVYCSKAAGDSCVSKEFCQLEPVRECKIIKTGTSVTGQTTCALRCYNKMIHGECLSGTCVSPQIPAVPSFDPENPDCSEAEPAPITL